MRLSSATLAQLRSNVARPAYDRDAQATGIVHLGIGAFHRAHQAVFTDDAMAAGDRDWAITGVSLRSPQVRDAMVPQDGLYSVTTRGGPSGDETRIIGAVRDVIVAPENPSALAATLAAPTTRIVTLTVTEKGYLRGPDGRLDLHAAHRGQTIYTILATAMRARRLSGTGGLTILSCDNLADNGRVLGELLQAYCERHAPEEAAWFARECACPSTMVDRIVPATQGSDYASAAERLGLRDEAAVVTEPFRQWVIEDRFATPRPGWHRVGAELVDDVRPYETAKLRMLNGAHSALAYLGLAAGHSYVHQAVADPALFPLIERLMRVEAARTIAAAPGQDIDAYADALLTRFRNTALPHRLAQIAMDGSQKIGQRWLESLTVNRARGQDCPATLTALAAWIIHVRGDNGPVDDPMAGQLDAIWRAAGGHGIAAALFGTGGLFASHWTASEQDLQVLTDLIAARG
ncbi:MAG: mannitol dehydrogenase family protein [Sphingomonas pseudosanguinis]|uniref:mannitol dehydrogenase family protein n=1 Tax=Sphingomonas pseudosanguinis TaxID=413712 RepID=UPI00391D3BEB